MNRLILLISLLMISSLIHSQVFERQVGLRLGVTSGITGKVIKDKKSAIQGTLGFRNGGIQLYTLLEAYKALDQKKNWFMYFGGGAHVGYVNGYNKVRRWSNSNGYYWEEEYTSGPVIGLDAVIGAEFSIPTIPLTLFAEFKPWFETQSFNKVRVNFYDFGFGIVYRFIN